MEHVNSVAKFETFTRIGFAARGIMYVMIAYLAIEAGRTTSGSGVLRSLADGGFSQVALSIMALGLLAYGVWRLADAGFDLEAHGSGAKGSIVRGAHGLSGVVHLFLGLLAAGLALGLLGGGGSSGSGGGTQSGTAWALGLPGGEWLVRLVGLGLIAGGVAQGVAAVRLRFLKHLDHQAAQEEWVKWAGRLGYIARGVIFVLIGLFFWQAGATSNARQAGGVGEALASLSGWVRFAAAAGLGLFGIFSFVEAIYRRINDPQVVERLKARLG